MREGESNSNSKESFSGTGGMAADSFFAVTRERERKRSQRGFVKGEILPRPPPSSSFEALSGWAALGREEHWTTKHKKPS
ncbi:predicted protein [Histoplasma mississippiense (nom. inval.)]|uniref:predicted protein n=1 Tax=Ajellomyces capsulatus (strain NAm1 / WU24) TaxID=2059318 RepID=UPI000157C686|nr:predicted protein [Histoplasma mississippiense (nom. inval.)]EDN08120.1 predicted protein [Histoplasma mississippiense (nom. inval.)]